MTLRLRPPARPAAILGLLTLGLTTAFLASPGARAEESKNLVSLQVRVLQDGAPLDADLDLTFEIHDVSSGGTPLWSETQTDVPVRNGILATTLGGITSLGNVFRSGVGSSSDRWVAIKQNSDEIVPRVKLTAVPYAQGATAADVASAIWNSTTGTALAITDIPSAIFGQGLEAASGLLRLAPATGAGLTGGGDDPLAVDPAAFVNSGNAAIDGDRLQIDFSPSNYTRNPASPAQSVNELAAHLRGIDEALVGGGGGGDGGGGDTESLRPGGRLTLSSDDPVPTSDIAAATTLYYLPYLHDRVPLWESGSGTWVARDFGAGRELSLSGASANTNYDVFAYWDDDSVELELGSAWTDDADRASGAGGISRKDGIWVKGAPGSQEPTRRLLGTIRITSAAGQCEDSHARRFVWNWDNRVNRTSYRRDNTSSWTYSGTSPQGFNGNDPDWKVEFIHGLADRTIQASLCCQIAYGSSGASYTWIGFGLDSTTVWDATDANITSDLATNPGNQDPVCVYDKNVGPGYHYLNALHSTGGAATIFYGGSGTSGMRVTIWN